MDIKNKLSQNITNALNMHSYKNLLLYEDNKDKYITEVFNNLNIVYKTISNIDKTEDFKKNSLLVISVDESLKKISDIDKKLGQLILRLNKNIILINKLNFSEYLDNYVHKVLMSLGFKLYDQVNQENVYFFLYIYNINNYKNVPDWLNSENWANPELWEK
ncbi:MAG: hypothetical protein CMD43_03265 [Gammaproteobacteria bacterium]|nr:hypothetical protein [Gammaproteobacteria bacterium]|tara:strand:- start:342 stop:824 length:483 start_codon:yes stop_codon:yes gene_type:complete